MYTKNKNDQGLFIWLINSLLEGLFEGDHGA